jgi:hypothetical protein
MRSTIRIGEIGNYYGGLFIAKEDSKYYWGIENYDGFFWEEIPEEVYNCLLKYENENNRN